MSALGQKRTSGAHLGHVRPQERTSGSRPWHVRFVPEADTSQSFNKSLHDAWADVTTPHGRLMLTVLGGLAEFERGLILSRTGEMQVVSHEPHHVTRRPTLLLMAMRASPLTEVK